MKKSSILILSMTAFLSMVGFRAQQVDDHTIDTKIELGEKLFFDPILSSNRSISCASCHNPMLAFADTVQFNLGVDGTQSTRNTPSVMNLAGRLHFFWDGRANSLEEQALVPITARNEMNLPLKEAIARLNGDKFYNKAFRKIFKVQANEQNLGEAIAAYERTLETIDTPYDRYINGNDNAMPAEAIRGRLLFIGKANCANCHSGEDFTADRFKNIGLYDGIKLKDEGRFAITKDSASLGHFKVPGLRNIALTAPYMHNGMFKTLKEVIHYYNHPDSVISNGYNRDLSLSKPLNLTSQEVDDLEAFLHALTDDRFIKK